MNSVSIKKMIANTNRKIETLKAESERVNAELKKQEDKSKTLSSLLKRQEAIDREFESLSESKAPQEKNAAADDGEPSAAAE